MTFPKWESSCNVLAILHAQCDGIMSEYQVRETGASREKMLAQPALTAKGGGAGPARIGGKAPKPPRNAPPYVFGGATWCVCISRQRVPGSLRHKWRCRPHPLPLFGARGHNGPLRSKLKWKPPLVQRRAASRSCASLAAALPLPALAFFPQPATRAASRAGLVRAAAARAGSRAPPT